MPDEHLTQQHLGHVITADKQWYQITKDGVILHRHDQPQVNAALTNLQRGAQWLENHLGIAHQAEMEEDKVGSVDIDQNVAILQV